jgi:hypothetical protein
MSRFPGCVQADILSDLTDSERDLNRTAAEIGRGWQ